MEKILDDIITMDISGSEACEAKPEIIELTFEHYFKNNYASLCRYAYTFVKQKDAAEDIVQDVFFNIWKSHPSPNYSEINKSYLYKSVKNNSINYLRHSKVIAKYAEQEYFSSGVNSNTPEKETIAADLSIEIDKAVESLPIRQREIFLLSRKNELTYKEIAAVLEISVKTVETQMGSALKSLRKYLSRVFLLF
jgi:RNA polymerase sigma-70 factor, ECF subfamily